MIHLKSLEYHAFVLNNLPKPSLLKQIIEDLNNSSVISSLSNKRYLLIALARCFFLVKQYDQSQDLLLQITLKNKVSMHNHYYLEIYLMEIICYYELKSYRIAKQKFTILKRKIAKEENMYEGLLLLIKKIGALVKFTELDFKLLNEIQEIIKENSNHLVFKTELYFLNAWLREKLTLVPVEK